MKSFLFCALLAFLAPQLLPAQTVSSSKNILYSDSVLKTYEIIVPADTLLWLYDQENLQSDYKFDAFLNVFEGDQLTDSLLRIGFRLRGNTSRFSQKKSFKVDFNEYVDDQSYYEVKSLNLNGEHNDPSIMRAKLSWDLLRFLRLPSSRAAHAKVKINGEYYGLYINVEHIDDFFISERFEGAAGNLYKCLYPADLTWRGSDSESYKFESGGRRAYELKTNEDNDDYSGLRDFIAFLTQTNDQEFQNNIEQRLDVDGVLRWLAADILTGNWDNYWHNKNNFYLYDNPLTGQFHFIPYDYDNTFGIAWDNVGWADQSPFNWTPTQEERPLVTRILSIPKYEQRLIHYLQLSLNEYFGESEMKTRWERLKSGIQKAAEEDTYRTKDYGYSVEDFNRSYSESTGAHDKYGIQPFIEARTTSLKRDLPNVSLAPWLDKTPVIEPYLETTIPVFTESYHHFKVSINVRDDEPVIGEKVIFYHLMEDETLVADTVSIIQRSSRLDTRLGKAETIFFHSLGSTSQVYFELIDSQSNRTRYPINPSEFYTYSSMSPEGLLINEFMASNETTITDEEGKFEDWIELYNNSNEPIQLSGYTITDKLDRPDKFSLPDTLLAPYAHLLLWADEDEEDGKLHLNFKLSKGGEAIGLFTHAGVSVDQITFGAQEDDQSFARSSDGSPSWIVQVSPTPGQPNLLTSIESPIDSPNSFAVLTGYPNPFNPNITLQVQMNKAGTVSLEVYDILGRNVHSILSHQKLNRGQFHYSWKASTMASGIYFVYLQSENGTQILPITLMK